MAVLQILLRSPAFSHRIFPSFSFIWQPGHGHNDGPRLRNTETTGPCECMLVQVHALYPHGHVGRAEEDENGGWRCVDTEKHSVFSLEHLPPGFIESNHLDSSDSANSYLTISSARKINDNGVQEHKAAKMLFQHTNSTVSERSSLSSSATDASDSSNSNEKNKIMVSTGATVTFTRGTQSKGRELQQQGEGRRLVGAGDPTGIHTLLVVRVKDKTGDKPSKSASQLSDDIFKDENNLVRVLSV